MSGSFCGLKGNFASFWVHLHTATRWQELGRLLKTSFTSNGPFNTSGDSGGKRESERRLAPVRRSGKSSQEIWNPHFMVWILGLWETIPKMQAIPFDWQIYSFISPTCVSWPVEILSDVPCAADWALRCKISDAQSRGEDEWALFFRKSITLNLLTCRAPQFPRSLLKIACPSNFHYYVFAVA